MPYTEDYIAMSDDRNPSSPHYRGGEVETQEVVTCPLCGNFHKDDNLVKFRGKPANVCSMCINQPHFTKPYETIKTLIRAEFDRLGGDKKLPYQKKMQNDVIFLARETEVGGIALDDDFINEMVSDL